MKFHADGNARQDRNGTLAGLFKAAFLPAALLVVIPLMMAGCGEPYPASGLTVTVNFDELPQLQSSGEGGFSTQAITGPTDPNTASVLSVVVGAIVISRSTPYTNLDLTPGAGGFTSAEQEALETDAKNSVEFISIIQLPYPSNTVSFKIPPKNAGNWQVAAVGLRKDIGALDEIENSTIWYGFTDTFMNDVVGTGSVVDLTMVPWCTDNDYPPDPIGGLGVC